MSATDRPMLIEYGGYLRPTPPVPEYTRNIARQVYREQRCAGLFRRQARKAAAEFILSAVSGEGRPTRKYQVWLDSVRKDVA